MSALLCRAITVIRKSTPGLRRHNEQLALSILPIKVTPAHAYGRLRAPVHFCGYVSLTPRSGVNARGATLESEADALAAQNTQTRTEYQDTQHLLRSLPTSQPRPSVADDTTSLTPHDGQAGSSSPSAPLAASYRGQAAVVLRPNDASHLRHIPLLFLLLADAATER
ncbi:hypothetical protein C8Q70DRAFT_1055722 [Cubamyces menziesii]|nr:hypothetical protein C8Q70DRAFT_1055722 [Cubamyces menziesii]